MERARGENEDGVALAEALVEAAAEGDVERVRALVAADGVDVESRSGVLDGAPTALIAAAESGKLAAVECLVDRGANINATDDNGMTPLMHAALEGALDVVQYLAGRGADVDVVDSDGETSLMKAASSGKLDVVKCLVDRGADVNTVNHYRWTPLMCAASEGALDIVQYLVDQGADVNATESSAETCLIEAASSGKLSVVEYFVSRGADVNTANDQGYTPLMSAASTGELDVVAYLVAQGADVSAVAQNGNTCLMNATTSGKLDVVQYFVDQGADVNVVDSDGWTPLLVAASIREMKVVQYLVDHGADVNAANDTAETCLMKAAMSADLEVVKFFVDRGADVNAVDNEGWTALMYAARFGKLTVVEYLVDRGADENVVDKCGSTSLMLAAKNGGLDIVQYFVDQGADVNAADNNGQTALVSAVTRGELSVVEYLLGRGANKNVVDNDGWTVLMHAASNGHLDVTRHLVDRGVEVDAVDCNGMTSLMHAASKGHLDVVQYFVGRGANMGSADNTGTTALTHATSKSHLDVVQYLVKQGADMNTSDEIAWTPLMYASMAGDLGVVKFLVDQGADVNLKNEDGETALYQATKHGHDDVRKVLLQRISSDGASVGGPVKDVENADASLPSLTSASPPKSWFVSPFDVELVKYGANDKSIGGEYRAKWLDADVVVKLFVSSASASTFEDEVSTWHQLRHPNVIKLYGACDVGHSFFVLEYASNGSLVEYLAACKRSGARQTPWKFLHEAALGLAYLHERGIVHGNLRSSNILIGSDGVAKLADFGLTATSQAGVDTASSVASGGGFGSARWKAPEQLEGGGASFEADIYSFGLCVVEVVTGFVPWVVYSDDLTAYRKERWDPTSASSGWAAPGNLDAATQLLTSRTCRLRPEQRVTALTTVRLLEGLAEKEANRDQTSLPEPDDIEMSVDSYNDGVLPQLLRKVRDLVSSKYAQDPLCQLALQEIAAIHDKMTQASRPSTLLKAYHSVLVDLESVLQSGSSRNRVAALSSTRAADNSLSALRRRLNDVWVMLDGARDGDQERELRWNSQRKKQLELFVSDVSETVTVLGNLNDEADKSAFTALLRTEIDSHASNYSPSQLAVMQKAYADVCRGDWHKSVKKTPVWFLPWYELVVNKMKRLGVGGFGDVYLAKWLDSEVVVKQVKTLGVSGSDSVPAVSDWSLIVSQSVASMHAGPTTDDKESRKALRAMFEREVDVWFGLSHPHVVRLFGACHIGTPLFFACEFAGGGSLDKYLRTHPDELWTKLLEAALGVQYLQSRGIVHGDLKCNNVVVGNDGKAKVTDFGLSSLEDEDDAKLTGAWQWVAPECIEHGASRRSLASDVYALGMCIVEALRVVEYVKLDKLGDAGGPPPLPWGSFDNTMVKYYVTRRELPMRPELCTDAEWKLVERMCAHEPEKRIKIGTVVDELAVFARGALVVEAEASAEPEREAHETDAPLSDVIVEMMKMCIELHGKAVSRDRKVLSRIHELIWARLAHLTSSVEKTKTIRDVECLRPLVERARESTLALREQKDTLVAFTEAALRGYAVHRGLDKVMDAQSWQVEGEGAVTVHEWRKTCGELLT